MRWAARRTMTFSRTTSTRRGRGAWPGWSWTARLSRRRKACRLLSSTHHEGQSMLLWVVYFLIALIVITFILWGSRIVLDMMELPAQIRQLVLVALSVICLIVLLVMALKAL